MELLIQGMLCTVRRTGDRSKRRRARPPIRRLAGWAGVDGNPLRRGIDVVERALWVILACTVIAVAPFVVPVAGHAAKAHTMATVRQEKSWQEVRAVLLRHAPNQVYGYNTSGTVWVSARWPTPAGRVRYGVVPTVVGAPAGTVVPVWVDQHGHLTGRRPLTAGAVGFRVLAVEVLASAGLAATALMLGWLLRWLTNRRRMACWGTEWACIGPRWSTRRR